MTFFAIWLYLVGAIAAARAINKTRTTLPGKLIFSLGWFVVSPWVWVQEMRR